MPRIARWPDALLAAGCLVLLLLSIAAWRLIDQEKALDRAQLRERLENAASLVVRESERALAQTAADEHTSLSVRWDERGLRRVSGLSLVWSPRPDPLLQVQSSVFEPGEDLEFSKDQPQQAIERYRALLSSSVPAVRAGALMRIARVQRKMGFEAAAQQTYRRLTDLGTAPAGSAPAQLVGLRESGNRSQLASVLEQGVYNLDRASFEFFAEGLSLPPELAERAEAIEQLLKRAAEAARGTELLSTPSGQWVAEWRREGNAGSGRISSLRSFGERLSRAMADGHVNWQLTNLDGKAFIGTALSSQFLEKKPQQTGLPWGVKVSLPTVATGSGVTLLTTGGILLALALFVTFYLAYRVIRRELHVVAMQSEFVAAVSHEFRTPLTALTHLTEMLETGEASEERKPLYYQALARETRRLRNLVENLLDFGRIESGRYRYKPQEVNALDFVGGVLEEFRTHPAAGGRELTLDATTHQAMIAVDREAMRRAVWNLLDNAAKYSPSGSPITTHLAESGGWTSVAVEDQGTGIAREDQKRIFQKFVRGTGSGTEQVKGTGIGLAMVDGIVRAHGGRVELSSRPGEGSRFTIVLPSVSRDS